MVRIRSNQALASAGVHNAPSQLGARRGPALNQAGRKAAHHLELRIVTLLLSTAACSLLHISNRCSVAFIAFFQGPHPIIVGVGL